jgi:hypothetical protein
MKSPNVLKDKYPGHGASSLDTQQILVIVQLHDPEEILSLLMIAMMILMVTIVPLRLALHPRRVYSRCHAFQHVHMMKNAENSTLFSNGAVYILYYPSRNNGIP